MNARDLILASAAVLSGWIATSGQTTTRIDLGPNGAPVYGHSYTPSVSADGRFVAFSSDKAGLVPGDTNWARDVFIHDRVTGLTERVSVDSSGVEANYDSSESSVSADGRLVAFVSSAANLVSGDTNGQWDVFLRDRQSSTTTRLSVGASGAQGGGPSSYVRISADGRSAVFLSSATNLVPGDTNGKLDVFVHDISSGQVTRVSVDSGGAQGDGDCSDPSISPDGRHVAFASKAANLVPGDTNGKSDVFVHDRQTGQTVRVSVSSTGVQATGLSSSTSISAGGRYVAFESAASNLTWGDTNLTSDVFVRDTQVGSTSRVSLGPGTTEANYGSGAPSISDDGRYVAFASAADNLVLGDTNGVPDVFVRDRQAGRTTRVSVSWLGYEVDATSNEPLLSADGRFVAFWSTASNLVPNGTGGACHIYVRDWWRPCYADSDLDGFGAGTPIQSPVPCGAGYSSVEGDCDDADAAIHPGAAERCNGIDDDCDGVVDNGFVVAYCTAGTTVMGCLPSIAAVGTPSSTAASGFEIVVSHVPALRSGTIFYGLQPTFVPWSSASASYLCVAEPIQRTGTLNSGGLARQCNGELRLDFQAWIGSHAGALGTPLFAGQVFYAQAWFRDPGAPRQSSLSDGLRFALCQ